MSTNLSRRSFLGGVAACAIAAPAAVEAIPELFSIDAVEVSLGSSWATASSDEIILAVNALMREIYEQCQIPERMLISSNAFEAEQRAYYDMIEARQKLWLDGM